MLYISQSFSKNSGAVGIRSNFFASSLNAKGVNLRKVSYDLATQEQDVEIKPKWNKNTNRFILRILEELRFGISSCRAIVCSPKSMPIMVTTPFYLSFLLISLLSVFLRRKLIVDIRDSYPSAYVAAGILRKHSFAVKVLNLLNKFIFTKSTMVVCATKGLMEEVSSVLKPSDRFKVSVTYNGFPAELLGKKQNLERTNDKLNIVFHGTLGKLQDVDFMIDLAKACEGLPYHFHVIGGGPKQSLFMEHTSHNITYYGRLPYDDTMKILEKMDVGLNFRVDSDLTRAAIPVKVWEYIGLEIPVLSYPPSEADDVLTEYGKACVLDRKDVLLARDVLHELVRHKPISNKFNSEQYTRERQSDELVTRLVKLVYLE